MSDDPDYAKLAREGFEHLAERRRSLQDVAEKAIARALLDATEGHGPHCESVQVFIAERERAMDLLDRVEQIVTRMGGHMSPADQATMAEVRAELVEMERRPRPAKTWRDRDS